MSNQEQYEELCNKAKKYDELVKAIAEIKDTGAYEQEVRGQTEFLKGINYCLNTLNKCKGEVKK